MLENFHLDHPESVEVQCLLECDAKVVNIADLAGGKSDIAKVWHRNACNDLLVIQEFDFENLLVLLPQFLNLCQSVVFFGLQDVSLGQIRIVIHLPHLRHALPDCL